MGTLNLKWGIFAKKEVKDVQPQLKAIKSTLRTALEAIVNVGDHEIKEVWGGPVSLIPPFSICRIVSLLRLIVHTRMLMSDVFLFTIRSSIYCFCGSVFS